MLLFYVVLGVNPMSKATGRLKMESASVFGAVKCLGLMIKYMSIVGAFIVVDGGSIPIGIFGIVVNHRCRVLLESPTIGAICIMGK